MKKLNWPTNKEQAEYMRGQRNQNHTVCLTNKNENWMYEILRTRTKYKWKRQAEWGYRVLSLSDHCLLKDTQTSISLHTNNLNILSSGLSFVMAT